MNRVEIRWTASFVVLTGVFYWIDQGTWFQELVLDKLSLFTAVEDIENPKKTNPVGIVS
jgi:hypothetical protein